MMTSITAQRTAVIDPSSPWPCRVDYEWTEKKKRIPGARPAGTAGLDGGPGAEERPDCRGTV